MRAATGAGAAYLVLGSAAPESRPLLSADAVFTGKAESDQAGFAAAGAGDVNADGYADLLVGRLRNGGHLDEGAAYLVLGSRSPASMSLAEADAQYTGEAVGDSAGYAVSSAGDVDRDGYDDILVGAIQNDDTFQNAGAAYVVRGVASPGSLSLSDADAIYMGVREGDFAGEAVASAGDVDGDGFADVLVGEEANDTAGDNAGAAYLLLGGVLLGP
jgi:hypothetical protein